jgi:hypothetical protein
MRAKKNRIERRLQISGALIASGLLVELISLIWSHPTAFLFFLLLGGLLMAMGILLFLSSLVAGEQSAVEGGQR